MKEENISSDLSDKDLVKIIEQNKTCNDCGKISPLWCSINNAVLLCASCARTHNKFNSSISRIKSLEVDIWTKDEISFLKLGGNLRFTNLIKSYNIPLTKDNQEFKYYTKAAQYYRDILSKEFKKEDINTIKKPSLREGIELLFKEEFSKLFIKQIAPLNEEYLNDNKTKNKNESFFDKMKNKINNEKDNNLLNDFTSNMTSVLNDVTEKAKNIDFKGKLKIATEYVNEQKEKLQNSETFKGFVNQVSNGLDIIFDKTEKFLGLNQVNKNDTKINSEIIKNLEKNNEIINNKVDNKVPSFKTNYTEINDKKNIENEKKNLNINNNEDNNEEKIDDKIKEENKEEELNKNEGNPNLLIMSNVPNHN